MTIFSTPALAVVDHPADGKHFGGLRARPEFIVLHATGGTSSLKWLTTDSPSSNPVSVHRLIDKDGTINKLVGDDDTAWHAGFGVIGAIAPDATPNLNGYSLGIELENLNDGHDPYPAAQVASCARQIVEWWGKYGFLPVLSHAAVDWRKNDPLGFDWQALWVAVWSRLPINPATYAVPAAVASQLHAADTALDSAINTLQ